MLDDKGVIGECRHAETVNAANFWVISFKYTWICDQSEPGTTQWERYKCKSNKNTGVLIKGTGD